MGKIHIGSINELDLINKVRREFPTQVEKVHSSAKGNRGYNRRRDKRANARDQE